MELFLLAGVIGLFYLLAEKSTPKMTLPSKPNPAGINRAAFHRTFLEVAKRVNWNGINPYMALAVSDVETGGGSNNLSMNYNNLFSLKVGSGWRTGGWKGKLGPKGSDGGMFRAYDNWQESMEDFVRLMGFPVYSKAYAGALAGNLKTFATELKKAGYDASNPKYAEAVINRYATIEGVV